MTLPDNYSDAEILAFLPSGTEIHPIDSVSGQRLVRTRRNGLISLLSNEIFQSMKKAHRGRHARDVADIYGASYTDVSRVSSQDYEKGRTNIFLLGNSHIGLIRPQFAERIWMNKLAQIIAALGPKSVCEIGSGSGRNLIYLANRIPDIRFEGLELTHSGTQLAQELQALDLHETSFGRWYGLDGSNLNHIRSIRFHQGSAMNIPEDLKQSDLVFTYAALEQMADGIEQALNQIRSRVREYALFFEPFADRNGILERSYLWSRNYFRFPSQYLSKFGFEVIKRWDVVPIKPTFAYSFVLCRPC